MVEITFLDGSKKNFKNFPTGFDIASSISKDLAKKSVAIKIDEKIFDLSFEIKKNSKIEILTTKSFESLSILRHTTAHIFAQSVLRLFKDAKIIIGPSVEDGFFYDVDCDKIFEETFPKIENEMRKIIKEDLEIKKIFKTKSEALKFFSNNSYKQEIIKSIFEKKLNEYENLEGNICENEKLSFYTQGEFCDLCSGPHLPRTSFVGAFKLEKISKVYFRGDKNNKQITRIYGTAFFKKKDLDDFLELKEEAKKRDHKVLAKKMKLYTLSELVGAGLPLFAPNGTILREEIINFLWGLHKNKNYKKVVTPHIGKIELYKKSGHYEHYKENFKVLSKDGEEFMLKPMNCPHHMQIFSDNFFSYKDMPIKYFEPAVVYRDELSGTLTGLTRVRSITQDDGHLFCRKLQIEKEIKEIILIVKNFYKTFNMLEDYFVSLSVRDSKNSKNYLGSNEIWESAESSLKKIAKGENLNYKIVEGEAAFYGPKIDFMFKDSLNRFHQLATIQLDFNLAQKFDLSFVNEKGEKETPIVIHRAISGSLERFLGVLIEHFAGKFPLWLAPTQIVVINVSQSHINYCEKISKDFEDENFRVERLFENESVGKKILYSQTSLKPNYIVVIGDENIKDKNLSIRTRKFENNKNEKIILSLEEFKKRLKKERDEKEIYE